MLQVVEQTQQEKEAMYMKCKKKALVKMLIEANRIIESRKPTVVIDIDSEGGNYTAALHNLIATI